MNRYLYLCDPALVKVDERKKLLNYPKVYLLLPFVGCHREKEREYGNWDDLVSQTKRSNISWWVKRERTQTLNFFLVFYCISNILVLWVTSSLKPLWSAPLKLGLVNLCLLKSLSLVFNCMSFPSTLAINCQKNTLHPLPSACCQWEKHSLQPAPHRRTKSWNLQFSLVIFNYDKSLDWRLETVCFFYSIILLFWISIFYESFNYVTLISTDSLTERKWNSEWWQKLMHWLFKHWYCN